MNQNDDMIIRKAAIDAMCEACSDWCDEGVCKKVSAIQKLPSAEPERKVFREMSDTEFEKWLHEHGICNPDIHESIPCDAIPSLIDFAINELPSAQPESCEGCKWEDAFGYGECDRCKRRRADMYEKGNV